MSPSLDGTMPESVISQENKFPLTLYIEFHNFYFLLDINTALIWQKEALTKVTFLVKEQNVSVIYTDVNGISGCLILHIS